MNMFKRVATGTLAAVMLGTQAAAAFKEVVVWGAKSINDSAGSDYRVSMEDVKDDLSDYEQTDGLREIYHVDQPAPTKVDLSEALSWLIDNNVFSRDEAVTISGVSSRGVPSVTITKTDMDALMGRTVNRSDAIMYLYKAVYGALPGRTIAVETSNIRMDRGQPKTLENILADFSKRKLGERYTPQGDEYSSIFGDTNIFIANNKVENHGSGGSGGTGIDGGTGGPGGDNNISIESDYKSISFTPGADLLFYRTADVLEMYIKAALSKGVLGDETRLRSHEFAVEFKKYDSNIRTLASWDGAAPAYIVNQSKAELSKPASVEYSSLGGVLGVNYTVGYSGSSVSIRRQGLCQSNSGYFTTEAMTKMDVYRYIYRFIYSNEKKMSDLEKDIINYKYGMQLEGTAEKADIEILKYLIAVGVLDYDTSSEMRGLYQPIDWEEFFPILYRVASKDARLDFSRIQLTDSEQQWKAKGFAPQTLYVVPEESAGTVTIEPSEEYLAESHGAGDEDGGGASPMRAVSVQYVRGPDGRIRPQLEAAYVEYLKYTVKGDDWSIRGYSYTTEGAAYSSNPADTTYYAPTALKAQLAKLDKMSASDLWLSYETHLSKSNQKHQIIANWTNNIYVIALCQSNQGIYNQLLTLFQQAAETFPAGADNNFKKAKRAVCNKLASLLANNVVGTNRPSGVTFEMLTGADGAGRHETWSSTTPPAGSQLAGLTGGKRLRAIAQSLSRITVTKGNRAYLTDVVMHGAAGGSNTGFSLEELKAAGTTATMGTKLGVTEADLREYTEADLLNNFGASVCSNGLVEATQQESAKLNQFTDATGKDAFIDWKSIESSNLPIQKISDMLLYNKDTGTYAYFCDKPTRKIALVGTSVVSGDSELGVAFKSGSGEAATFYYHSNAIRLLMNAKQESSVLSGVRGIVLADANIQAAIEAANPGKGGTVPLESESGYNATGLVGFRAMISANDAATLPQYNAAKNPVYTKVNKMGNTRWGDFISLSQANRAANMISRRVVYKSSDGNKQNVAYAIVLFHPADLSEMGSATLGADASMQDLLDSAVKPPDTPAGKAIWTSNKALCNLYANWIYGTSGQTYIETGFLRPEPIICYRTTLTTEKLPQSAFSPMTEEQAKAVTVLELTDYTQGAAIQLGRRLDATAAKAAQRNAKMKASYALSDDCRVLVSGDRVYLNAGCFDNLSSGKNAKGVWGFKVNNSMMQQTQFTLGSTFKVANLGAKLGNGMQTPEIKVVETKKDGTVICQVGPIYGIPVVVGKDSHIVDATKYSTAVKKVSGYSTKDWGNADSLLYAYNKMFTQYKGITYLGISKDPTLQVGTQNRAYVYDGLNLSIFIGSSTKPIATVKVPQAETTKTIKDNYNSLKYAVANKRSDAYQDINTSETYFKISFPASKLTLAKGVLRTGSSVATDYLSPSLFGCLNDLIIDEMMDASNGAIPVNNIPSGAMLRIGSGYYAAVGSTSKDKSFVGYAALDAGSFAGYKPTIVDAAKAFGDEFIRGGNQYINVSHYFGTFTVLSKPNDASAKALKAVAAGTLSTDGKTKYQVDAAGASSVIAGASGTGDSSTYAPVKVVFQQGLLAYKTSAPDSTLVTYQLVSHAENAIGGPFAELPFYTDNVLDTALFDQTTNLLSAGFTTFAGADSIRERLELDFRKALAGDLFTLFRMLVFIVLVWLVVASWMCYGMYFSNMMPILDSIRYPTGNRQGKGFDLMRLISLRTISMDDDFKLGRFIQYDLILAVLIGVVWATGSITFG